MDQKDSNLLLEHFETSPICLAPMVDMGDLAFRILVRRHCVKVCWTGMINANQWNMSKKYQQTTFQTNEIDKPLICQLSGSLDSGLLAAAESLSYFCCAVDINLGCCQKVAKRGNYGYYCVDTEEKRKKMLSIIAEIAESINVPLTAKIRMIDDDIELTVAFAKQLEAAGVKLITVHARSVEQDKHGNANTECIEKIIKSVKIPVVANGGITSLEAANVVIKQTGAKAAMVGQALLKNPALFDEGKEISSFDIALEYLQIFKEVGGGFEIARRHMFYIFDEILGTNNENRKKLAETKSADEIVTFIEELRSGLA